MTTAPVGRQFKVGGCTLGGSEFCTTLSPASIVQKAMPISADIKDRDGSEGSLDCAMPRAEQLPLALLGSLLAVRLPDPVDCGGNKLNVVVWIVVGEPRHVSDGVCRSGGSER